jgi:hypothetical protein
MSTPEPGPAPDDSLEPFPTATVSEAEVSIRRAPKVPVFLVLGGLIGGIVSAAITSAFPIDEKIGYAATVGYFLLYGIPIGIVLGALLALILDRVSVRRARTIVAERVTVDALPYDDEPIPAEETEEKPLS